MIEKGDYFLRGFTLVALRVEHISKKQDTF